LFPSIRQHKLLIAHRRLIEKLAANSRYRQTVFPGYVSAASALIAAARTATQTRRSMATA